MVLEKQLGLIAVHKKKGLRMIEADALPILKPQFILEATIHSSLSAKSAILTRDSALT